MSKLVTHSSVDCGWKTPSPMYLALDKAARGFEVDLAADSSSAKQSMFFGPGSPFTDCQDSLKVEWHAIAFASKGFLNPPYSKKLMREGVPGMDIAEWAAKCWRESKLGFEVWGIFPYSPQTDWWRRNVEGHEPAIAQPGYHGWSGHAAMEVWRLPYRVDFDPTEATKARIKAEFDAGQRKSGEATGAGHNVAIVIWRPNPGFVGPWVPTVRYWSYR